MNRIVISALAVLVLTQMKPRTAIAALILLFVQPAFGAVQWRIEDGGNGHWYEWRTVELTFEEAHVQCLEEGGGLAEIHDAAEWDFVRPLIVWGAGDSWLGAAMALDGSASWLSGEPIGYFNLPDDGSPCCLRNATACANAYPRGLETIARYAPSDETAPYGWCWQDAVYNGWTVRNEYVIEWSADCNEDGIVDYGQILDGALSDSDGNGIPDQCESVGTDAVPWGRLKALYR